MYPGPADADHGVFVAQMERALAARGHEIERAVLETRAGGKLRYLELFRRARRARPPDVVYAHFLVPTGLLATLAQKAPVVLTAHGQDVANIGSIWGVAAATRFAVARAVAVIAVSDYLRRELEARVPQARGKTEVVSMGVDLDRFRVVSAPPETPAFVCVGSLTERKNVVRLAEAFARVGNGSLTFVGDGPLRAPLERFERVRVTGVVAHDAVPDEFARASVVCQPSLVEPLGQALLEGMACGRPVVATSIGGPPEFVPDGAGVLVDPMDVEAIADGLRRAASLPVPNRAARAAAERHDVNEQARRVEAILQRAAGSRRRS